MSAALAIPPTVAEPMTPEPSGCTHCGAARRGHFQRWRDGIGWHRWTAPTQEQIKERMLVRRALKAGV